MEFIDKALKRERDSADSPSSTPTVSGSSKRYTYDEATKKHPFIDWAQFDVLLKDDVTLTDANGKIVCHVLRDAYPRKVADMGAGVLREAATRTTLRALIFGGIPPRSGIAGYYDYFGSPIEFKCRKTSFTDEYIKTWPNVFPLVEYVNEAYKQLAPKQWNAQNAVIPDLVRIRNSVFSTLTINERFRTARHTDSGDYDEGLGCISVIDGKYDGLHLGFPDFGVCVELRPRDVMLFNTHFFHCNTEAEVDESYRHSWSRLSVVFYYRTNLGSPSCLENYRRRFRAQPMKNENSELHLPDNHTSVVNRLEIAKPDPFPTPASAFIAWARRKDGTSASSLLTMFVCLHEWFQENESLWKLNNPPLPARCAEDYISPLSQFEDPGIRVSSGFSEKLFSEQSRDVFAEINTWGLPSELLEMYKESRESWLQRVKADWSMQSLRNSSGNFTWANKGEVNRTFFDLCDVASGIMRFLLADHPHSEITNHQKSSFFGALAVHLFHSCSKELKMPSTAMTLRKLNVKLKDYEFGGTRYFKDLSPDEQKRRTARRERIEQARLTRPCSNTETVHSHDWLLNDSFDYQCEDAHVDYQSQNIPKPALYLSNRILDRGPNCTPLNKLTLDSHKRQVRTSIVLITATDLIPPQDESQLSLLENAHPEAFKRLSELGRTEYNRIVSTFMKQVTNCQAFDHWTSTKTTECRVISCQDVFRLNIPESIVIVPWVLHVADESFIRVLSRAGKFAIFSIRNTLDPRHFLLKPHLQAAFAEAIPYALKVTVGPSLSIAQTLPVGSSIRGLCEFFSLCGYKVLGIFHVRESAFGDLWISCIPDASRI